MRWEDGDGSRVSFRFERVRVHLHADAERAGFTCLGYDGILYRTMLLARAGVDAKGGGK